MNPDLWAAFTVLCVLLSLSPGPAVLTVIAQGMRHGWRLSAAGALGILSGNAIYFTLSALGLGAFVAASPRLLGVLRWGGIAFLVWTALRSLLAKPDPSGAVASAPGTRRALYLQGLTTQLANPKTIVFFVSLLAPFIDPRASWPPAAQIAVYAATSIAVELPILVGYGVAGAHGRRLIPGGRAAAWEGRIAGACMLAVAVWIALR